MPLKKKKKSKPAPKKKAVKRKAIKKAIKRKPAKKRVAARKKVAPKKPAVKGIKGTLVGTITHYFPHVMAGVLKLKAPLDTGDSLQIKGHTTDFKQAVVSIQIDRVPITQGKKGQEIGLLVESRVRRGDKVYKL